MPITLAEAAERIGDLVIYQAAHAGAYPEEGVITSVNHRFVFVRYNNANTGWATRPEDLRFTSHG